MKAINRSAELTAQGWRLERLEKGGDWGRKISLGR